MFKEISDQIQYPTWVGCNPRYRKLDLLDRFLDGTFYDQLAHSFYTESTRQQEYIPLTSRRPSVRHRIPLQVARQTARKLFAGRHVPRINHPDETVRAATHAIIKKCKLWSHMLQAAIWGSVGSVAATFCVVKEGDQPASILIETFRAKQVWPRFDKRGELDRLRIAYVCKGYVLAGVGLPVDNMQDDYWYIRDVDRTMDIVYRPIRQDKWSPAEDGMDGKETLSPIEDKIVTHNFGFVPGHWFVNLSGGSMPDGCCTWEAAANTIIEMDYTMSQMGRGGRYSAAPQLFISGELQDEVDGGDGEKGAQPIRSTAVTLRGLSSKKDQGGEVYGETKAELLEMTGNGLKAVLEYVNALHKRALEEISSARKDPETMKGPASGRAMELIDEEFHDLVQELRQAYGEDGALPFLRKILRAYTKIEKSAIFSEEIIGAIGFNWGRLFQTTPADLTQIVPALVMAVYPAAQRTGSDAEGKPVLTQPKGLLTIEQATMYLVSLLDLPDDAENATADPTDMDDETPVADDLTETAKDLLNPPKYGERRPIHVDA